MRMHAPTSRAQLALAGHGARLTGLTGPGAAVQGLEPEMQRQMSQHQAELHAAKQAAADASQERVHQIMMQVGPHTKSALPILCGSPYPYCWV